MGSSDGAELQHESVGKSVCVRLRESESKRICKPECQCVAEPESV
jgi:hypothetical protein